MVSLSFKMMAFSVFLNLAVGMFMLIGSGGGAVDGWSAGELQYNSETNDLLNDDLAGAFASPPVEDTTNFGEKLLDFFSLGLYTQVKNFLNSTLLALPNFFLNAGIINNTLQNFLSSFFLLLYTVGMFELFTGKRLWG